MHDSNLDAPLAEPALGVLFSQLREAGEGPAPAIRDDLAALLSGSPLERARDRRRRMSRAGITGLVTAGLVASGLGAAAANELPPPAQRVVSTVVNTLTPFDLPKPGSQGPVEREVDGDQPGHDVSTPRVQPSTIDDSTDDDVDEPSVQPTPRDDDRADEDAEARSPGSDDDGERHDGTDRELNEVPDSDASRGGSDSDGAAESGDAERSDDSDDSEPSGGSGDEDTTTPSGDEQGSESDPRE